MDKFAPVDIQNAQTMPQLIRAAHAAFGRDTAISLTREDGREENASFADLDMRSAAFAKGLIARGAGKGSRIGFICGNGPLFALMMAAIGRIGAIAVPISTMIRAGELVRVLRQSDISGLFLQRELLGYDYAERLVQAVPAVGEAVSPALYLPELPYLRWVISSGDALPAAIQSIDTLEKEGQIIPDALLLEMESEVHPADQLVEIYTSGSMALPKGVRHMHGPVLFRARFIAGMIGCERGKQKHAAMPMFWVGGMIMALIPNWISGAQTTCADRTLNNSRMAMGSVLSEEDLALIKNAKPWWGLGMSETLGPYSYGDEFRATGYPVCAPLDNIAPGFEVRVADAQGRDVANGEVGELLIRGYPLAAGLHKMERSEHYTPDGFYHTGDMVQLDKAGKKRRLHFVGRSGDMIKTAGSNVSPAEVEMEMQALDGIHNAYVFGLPDEERGQLLVAAVVPREGAHLDFAIVQQQLKARLSPYKVPRAYALFSHAELPMLASNKVARRELAKLLAERLAITAASLIA